MREEVVGEAAPQEGGRPADDHRQPSGVAPDSPPEMDGSSAEGIPDRALSAGEPGRVAVRDLFETRAAERLSASRYDALLRELLTFGLVETTLEGGRRSWRLTPAAVARLDHLRPPSVQPGRTMHFGRRCDECYEPTVTRLIGGRYLCVTCLAALEGAPGADRTPPDVVDRPEVEEVPVDDAASPALSSGPIVGAA